MVAWSAYGLMIEVAGLIHTMSIGARVVIETGESRGIRCEVVGFSGANALLMPFGPLEGVRRGCRAIANLGAGCGAAVAAFGQGYQRLEQILGNVETEN